MRYSIYLCLLIWSATFQSASSQSLASEVYDQVGGATVTITTDQQTLGNGFFIGENLIVTNFHLIERAKNLQVRLRPTDKSFEIEGYVAFDEKMDLIVLKTKENHNQLLALDTENVNSGDEVFAIDTSQKNASSPLMGFIRGLKYINELQLIQTSLPSSQEISGSPLLSKEGKVLGVVLGKMQEGQNFAFAIPANSLFDLVSNQGYVKPIGEYTPNQQQEITLDQTHKQEFSQKALWKTEDLGRYLSIISDKEADPYDARKAVEMAVKLFYSEQATVEVSSLNGDKKSRAKVRKYFNNLRLLKYDKIEILWSDIAFVSKLRPGPDGNYYGVISTTQRFRGMNDGKLTYSDTTIKHIEIVLKQYEKIQDGQAVQHWDVFLGDIGVQVTKS